MSAAARTARAQAGVRDFYGVLQHEQADRGAIVTAGEFTDQARRWAAGKPIELIDGEEVVRITRRARVK